MARVNHKLVKQRLHEERSKITDRQFFSSRLLAGHFEDLATVQTRRYHYNRRVRVNLYWDTEDPHVASTDNTFIRVNAGNSIVTNIKGRENRYQIVCGLFTHEMGHVLYTDFLAAQSHANYLARGHWYPYPPDLQTAADSGKEKAFWNYVKADPENLEMVQMIAHYISNVIEDGYVENRMLMNFPGTLGYSLEKLRELQLETIPTVTQLIELEENGATHIFESILQIMLSYAKYGEIKYGDEPLSDERIQTIFSLISDIDNALLSRSGKERLRIVNLMLVRCWDYIENFCEECKNLQKDAASKEDNTSAKETLSKALRGIAGGSAIGKGSSTPVSEASGGENKLATSENRAKTHTDAGKSQKSSTGKPEETQVPQTDSETEKTSSEAEENNASLENDSSLGKVVETSIHKADKQKTSELEKGRIPYYQSESLSEPYGGTIRRNDCYEREQDDRAAEDIERILDKMAEKAACEQLENERILELNDAAQNISYGNIHSGVNIQINRIASVDEELVEQYDAISAPLINISRRLQKSLVKQLKENRRGGKQTGLIMGRRLDAHALCRNDGKVFYKSNLPNETPELAVGLLLDESGSMSSCDRSSYARASAIILYDFCQSLNIPVMVYGHSTDYTSVGHTVALYSYAEFDGIDHDDKYRMMDISARGGNRDGAALRYVAERLSKRPEAVKLLILVSDGQPNDFGYGGSAAEEDLRGIKQEYQRKGILFVAAAIGNDKRNIERIYGDSFLNISDLSQLPVKLTSVVKRHVRV